MNFRLPCFASCALLLLPSLIQAQTIGVRTVSGSQQGRGDVPRVSDVLYVDAGATGADNGSSWGNAFVDLQDALALAKGGDQVWVAAGTYKPGPIGGANDLTFAVPSGVELYGGFAGGETSLNQRDWALNPAVLSGDLAGDDTYTPIFNMGWGDNAWNIVTLDGVSASTRVDGFSIIGGSFHAAPWEHANGAGVYALNGARGTIANCEFSWCVANHGGAIYVGSGDVIVENGDFHNNYATTSNFAGGAISNDGGASVTIRDSSFTRNTADGVWAGVGGGALANAQGATMVVERCTFTRNSARNRQQGMTDIAYGGAIYNQRGNLWVSDSVFTSNDANTGGAVYAWTGSTTTLVNSLFIDNWVIPYLRSGGIEGGGDGGTVVAGTGFTMVGCTVTGGSADNIGGVSAGAGFVSSCIFWGNEDDKGSIGISQIKVDGDLFYSCVENMLVGEPNEDPPDPEKFPGCTDADPLFVNPFAGDYRVSAGSPVIDAGENPAFPSSIVLDLDGHARFFDDPNTTDTGVGPAPVVDMGPYEFGSSQP